ncbi:MAG: DUF7619 domain-containing protein, partial [Planctomycetota bacterium]
MPPLAAWDWLTSEGAEGLFTWWYTRDYVDIPTQPVGEGSSGIARAVDPNDKIAPGGYGEASFVREDDLLPYKIRFENEPDATAPAHLVTISDTLDEDLDLSTFELTEIGFVDQTIIVPEGLSHYQTSLDLVVQNELHPEPADLRVQIDVALDMDTRELTFEMIGVDPLTGWLPEDIMLGILYPNDDTARGEGFLSYTVKPKAGLATGTEITNQASIVFDWNDPIDTPQVLNTIDALAPTSHVHPLPSEVPGILVDVSWSGEDEPGGSGIASYDIYVSEDAGPFELWLDDATETSAEFTGELEHTYAFCSVATDNVGHVEAFPVEPDAQTTLIPGVVDRRIFYNGSVWDWDLTADANGNGRFDSGEDGPLDDLAVAAGKEALLPGETAAFTHYTSYNRGITGIMVDIAGLAATPTEEDFEFKLGNDSDPDSWSTFTTTPAIDVRLGDGKNGSDRLTLTWPDNVIPTRNWLQVRVKATPNTGSARDEVFYFGNVIGDADGDHVAACADMYAIYQQLSQPADVESPVDIDRDGVITQSDMDAVFSEAGRLSFLNLITVPSVVATDDAAETDEDTIT